MKLIDILNESPEGNQLSDVQKKKAKLIHRAHKRGSVEVNYYTKNGSFKRTYRYEFPENILIEKKGDRLIIKFPVYHKDFQGNEPTKGEKIPLKIWRVKQNENKLESEIYLNNQLTGSDVIDLLYGGQGSFSIHGTEFQSVIGEIAKRYKTHGVYINMLPMDDSHDDSQSLKEEGPLKSEEEKKKIKTTKNVFKAFKKGTIQIPHPRNSSFVTFKYKINDNVEYWWDQDMDGKKHYTINTSKKPGEDVIIYTDDEYLEDRCNNDIDSIERNPYGIHVRRMVIDQITNKFKKFGVKLNIDYKSMKFVLDNYGHQ